MERGRAQAQSNSLSFVGLASLGTEKLQNTSCANMSHTWLSGSKLHIFGKAITSYSNQSLIASVALSLRARNRTLVHGQWLDVRVNNHYEYDWHNDIQPRLDHKMYLTYRTDLLFTFSQSHPTLRTMKTRILFLVKLGRENTGQHNTN